MCLYPKLIRNRKYIPNKKNGGNPPPVTDPRTLYVPVGCNSCIECRKQKSRSWSIRLQEEIRVNKGAKFITLSFSEQSLIELDKAVQEKARKIHEEHNKLTGKKEEFKEITGYELDNAIATLATRRFLERWRAKNKTSVRHWLINELGDQYTERLHLHGIIFGNVEEIKKHWQYGNVWAGDYVNESTINYIVKYVYKTNLNHKYFKPIILTSAGMGKGYLTRPDVKKNEFKGEKTDETYRTRQGIKLNLPIYYRNKIYTEKQREDLWINMLNKEIRWVMGSKIDVSESQHEYEMTLKAARVLNKQLGYGNDTQDKERLEYERQRRNIQRWTRIMKEKAKKDL